MSRVPNLAVIFIAGTLSLAAFGQTPQAPAENQTTATPQASRQDPVASRLDQMNRRLNLTSEQREQITPVLQDEVQQARAIRQDKALTHEQKLGKLRQLHDATRAQVESLLTPEQVAKMARPGARRAMARRGMARMAQRLNLSEDQKSKMKPMFADQHKQVQAVRADASLSPAQKQNKIREIRKATHQQFLALLTPEQQQQLKGMRQHRRRGGAEPTPQAPASTEAQP